MRNLNTLTAERVAPGEVPLMQPVAPVQTQSATRHVKIYPPKKSRVVATPERIKKLQEYGMTYKDRQTIISMSTLDSLMRDIDRFTKLQTDFDKREKEGHDYYVARAAQEHKEYVENVLYRLSETQKRVDEIKKTGEGIEHIYEIARARLAVQIKAFKKMSSVDSVTFKTWRGEKVLEIKTTNIDTANRVLVNETYIDVPVVTLPRIQLILRRDNVKIKARDIDGQSYAMPFIGSSSNNQLGANYTNFCLGSGEGQYTDAMSRGEYALAYTFVLQILKSFMLGTSGYTSTAKCIARNGDLPISYPELSEGDTITIYCPALGDSNLPRESEEWSIESINYESGLIQAVNNHNEEYSDRMYVFNNSAFINPVQ